MVLPIEEQPAFLVSGERKHNRDRQREFRKKHKVRQAAQTFIRECLAKAENLAKAKKNPLKTKEEVEKAFFALLEQTAKDSKSKRYGKADAVVKPCQIYCMVQRFLVDKHVESGNSFQYGGISIQFYDDHFEKKGFIPGINDNHFQEYLKPRKYYFKQLCTLFLMTMSFQEGYKGNVQTAHPTTTTTATATGDISE